MNELIDSVNSILQAMAQEDTNDTECQRWTAEDLEFPSQAMTQEGTLQRMNEPNPSNWYDTRDYVTRAFDEAFGIKDTTSDELLAHVNFFNEQHAEDEKMMTFVDMRDWDNVRIDDTFLDEVLYVADYRQYVVLLVYDKPKTKNKGEDE